MPQRTNRHIEYGTLKGAERYTDTKEGILFPVRPGFLLGQTAFAVLAATAVCFVAFVLGLGLSGSRGYGWMALLVCLYILVVGVRSFFRPRCGIVLLPEGIFLRGPDGTAWVRWDGLTSATVATQIQYPYSYLQLQTTGFRSIELGGLIEHLPVPFSPLGIRPDVAIYTRQSVRYPGRALMIEPDALARTIRHYLEEPSERRNLNEPSTVNVEERRAVEHREGR